MQFLCFHFNNFVVIVHFVVIVIGFVRYRVAISCYFVDVVGFVGPMVFLKHFVLMGFVFLGDFGFNAKQVLFLDLCVHGSEFIIVDVFVVVAVCAGFGFHFNILVVIANFVLIVIDFVRYMVAIFNVFVFVVGYHF